MNKRTDLEKWAALARMPARDARHPDMRREAELLWRASLQRPHLFAALALALAQHGIRYQTDTDRTGREDIAGYTRKQDRTPLAPLIRGVDDCDAKARLFVALMLARGVRAEMVPHWNLAGDVLEHVSARVMLGGKWFPVETTLARALVGEVADHVPLEASGQWAQ